MSKLHKKGFGGGFDSPSGSAYVGDLRGEKSCRNLELSMLHGWAALGLPLGRGL